MRRPCRRRSDYLRRIGHSRLDLSAFSAGLVGYWTMDKEDIVGSSSADLSGEGNTGTIVGAAEAEGQVGQALSFDGVDDYVSMADSASLDITDEITLSAWVKPNILTGNYGIVDKYTLTAGNRSFRLYQTNTDIQFQISSDGNNNEVQIATANLTTDWQYIVVVYNSGIFTAYRNGVSLSVDDNFVFTSMNIGGSDLWIGQRHSLDAPFNGSIDEVRIYNRALSVAEIVQYYNATRG